VVTASLFVFSNVTNLYAADTVALKFNVTYGQTEARTMLSMVNKLRTGDEAWYWDKDDSTKIKAEGLGKLVYDYDLEVAAMQRAAEIAVYYNHMRPSGENCFTAYAWSGCCAENIAYGYNSAEAVFEAWKEDNEPYMGQGHRRNMLNSNIKAIAIGHAYYNGQHYWVQEFRGNVVSDVETVANDSETKCSVDAKADIASEFEKSMSKSTKKPVEITTDKTTEDTNSKPEKYVVKLKKTTINVKKGKTYTLKYSITKGYTGKVKFISSNKKIAKVSAKGKVRGIKKGKCKITVRLNNGKKAVAKITVK